MHVTNVRGRQGEALAVAEANEAGVEFPLGTIIQLFFGEASVKRGGGFSPASNGWEFFELEATAEGTTIVERGVESVKNFADGNCFSCHVAAAKYDFVCEQDHGCVDLGVTDEQIAALAGLDPRCR